MKKLSKTMERELKSTVAATGMHVDKHCRLMRVYRALERRALVEATCSQWGDEFVLFIPTALAESRQHDDAAEGSGGR